MPVGGEYILDSLIERGMFEEAFTQFYVAEIITWVVKTFSIR